MVSKKEMKILMFFADIVRKEKNISRRQLILKSPFSISYTEKLLPYLPEYFEDIIFEKSNSTYQTIQTEGEIN